MQYFHPRSGTTIRCTAASTRSVRQTAPRVVMFGITNACNLACAFCSRDTGADSLWTEATAFAVLRDLSAAGTLEVAFGGGEPFAFPGFDALIAWIQSLEVTATGQSLGPLTSVLIL